MALQIFNDKDNITYICSPGSPFQIIKICSFLKQFVESSIKWDVGHEISKCFQVYMLVFKCF